MAARRLKRISNQEILIYVPPKTITNVARFMNDVQGIMQPFMTAEQMVVLWPSFRAAIQGTGGGLQHQHYVHSFRDKPIRLNMLLSRQLLLWR